MQMATEAMLMLHDKYEEENNLVMIAISQESFREGGGGGRNEDEFPQKLSNLCYFLIHFIQPKIITFI